MSLEQLIMRYIDGELSSADDNALREMIRVNPEAKELFESYIEVHLAMQENMDSPSAPESLISETEDIIMMKIMKEEPKTVAPVSNTISEPEYSQGAASIALSLRNILNTNHILKYSGYAAAAVLLLFISIANINEGEFPAYSSNSDQGSEIIQDKATEQAQELMSPATASTTPEQILADKPKNEADALLQNIQPFSMQTGDIEALTNRNSLSQISDDFRNIDTKTKIIAQNEFSSDNRNNLSESNTNKNETLTNSMDYIGIGQDIASSANPLLIRGQNDSRVSPVADNNSILKFSQVQLTSFAGMDYFRSGFDIAEEIPISHYAQSISYAHDETNRFGLEFGYSEYVVFKNINVNLPGGILVVTPGGGVDPSNSGADLPLNNLKTKQPVRLFWGSAFYERTLINEGGFSLNGRIGAGATSSGPLGYIRIFAKQQIITGIYLTLGTEGRIFKSEHPLLNNDGMFSSATLVYGLQFAF